MELQKILKECEEKMKKSILVVQQEVATIHTGKASSSLVEGILVDCYGSQMRLKEVAAITTPEPRMIVIHPWDPSQIPFVEKAITNSGLGIQPMNDGKIIRLPLPELSQERRESLIKVVKKMAEDARISVRNIRRDTNALIQKFQKEGKLTEDEKFNGEKKTQERTDHYTKQIDDLLKHKEKEILSV